MDVDRVLDQNGLRLEPNRPFEDACLGGLVLYLQEGLLLRRYLEDFGLNHQDRPMVVAEFDCANCLAVIFDGYFFLVLLAYFEEAHVNKGFEQYLAFHFVDPDREFDGESIFADDFDDFGLVFEFLAFVLDLGGGGKSGGDFGLHGVDDFEVGVFGFLEADAFGAIGEVADLDRDFIVLVDFDVLEDHLCRDDLEGLGVDRVLLGGGTALGEAALTLHH